jgi:hypothetical protein
LWQQLLRDLHGGEHHLRRRHLRDLRAGGRRSLLHERPSRRWQQHLQRRRRRLHRRVLS